MRMLIWAIAAVLAVSFVSVETVLGCSSNQNPVAVLSASPSTVPVDVNTTLDGSSSYDPDGSITKCEWDWTNDGSYDYTEYPGDKKATHAYSSAGTYTAKLRVTDNWGDTGTDTCTVVTLDPNLVAYWRFDDGSGITASDSTDNEHDGTLAGEPNWVSGFVNGALDFNGVSDYVSVGSSSDFDSGESGQMTFTAYIQSDDYSPKQVVLSRRYYCNNEGHFNIYTQDHRVYFGFYCNLDGKQKFLYSGKILKDEQAYRIFWLKKWNDTGTKLYVNGYRIKVYGDNDTKGNTHSYLPVFIGAQSGPGNACDPNIHYHFDGIIDEAAIWNKILSTSEMEEFCNDEFPEPNTYEFENDYAKLKINSLGLVESLTYNEVEQLKDVSALSKINYDDGSGTESTSITDINDTNEFIVKYLDTNTEVKIEITAQDGYFKFEILDVNDLDGNIDTIELFAVDPCYVPQRDKDWAISADSNELFLHFLPLQVETVCGSLSVPWFTSPEYGCKTCGEMGLSNGSGALLTAPKSQYWAAMEDMIDDCNLPKVLHDGEWFRVSDIFRESYLFASLTSSNKDDLLDYAKKGKFKQFLALHPVSLGSYNEPRAGLGFSDMNDFYDALAAFDSNGVKVGIHTFLNTIESSDKLFSDANYPKSENLYKEEIGALSESISAANDTITLNNNLLENNTFLYFSTGTWAYYTSNGYYVLIDEEIIRCDSVDGNDPNRLCDCSRGMYSTAVDSHTSDTDVYLLLNPGSSRFLIAPDSNLAEVATASFADMIEDSNSSLLYVDSRPFPGKPGMDNSEEMNYALKFGIVPYLNDLNDLVPVQVADTGASYGWYYYARGASWDGVVFKNKDFTKRKATWILEQNPYGNPLLELGWWKIHGSDFSDGKWDYDAVTFDDIHYAMTKALVLDTSIGVQLSSNYEKHALLNTSNGLLELIGLYHELIEQDINEPNFVPQNIKDHLKQIENEAEISKVVPDTNDANSYFWNLVEKKMDRQYAVWDSNQEYTYDVNNPFAGQKLKLEIRARSDYYDFNDPCHLTISNFTGNWHDSNSTWPSGSVSCDINDNTVTITNSSTTTEGYCKIVLSDANAPYNLTNKRGVGLSVTGDGKGEEVIVHLATYYGVRDFKLEIDPNFTSQKTMILGDAAPSDRTGGLGYIADYGEFWRHWNFDYSNVSGVSIYIYVKPNDTYSLTFHSLKGLAEKGGSHLKNPSVTVDSNTVTFPVDLYVLDSNVGDSNTAHILVYDGDKYTLYSPLYDLISGPNECNDLTIDNGLNTIKISSDTSDSMYSTRADVRVAVYDDGDMDGIPTNGDYSSDPNEYTPYDPNSRKNFFDDNCCDVYNPEQTDSDGDGIGDACEQ